MSNVYVLRGERFELPAADNTSEGLAIFRAANEQFRRVPWPAPFNKTTHQLRLGDGAFGVLVPGSPATVPAGMKVGEGVTANIEIGIEVKILMKAMIKQIDRVESDLRGQAAHFRKNNKNAICVAVVGINQAPHCTTYEGVRANPTDGKKHKHPITEAAEAERRLIAKAAPDFDEFIVLRFIATNEPPFAFSWVNAKGTALDYGAALARISQKY